MVTEELATGLSLDLPLQQYIERFTNTRIGDFLLLDALHSEENLKIFSLLSYKASLLKSKTIYNPPLQQAGSGTDATSTGTGSEPPIPIIGTTAYRVAFYNIAPSNLFVKVRNMNDMTETYLIRRKDLDYWNNTVNKIKKDYYN